MRGIGYFINGLFYSGNKVRYPRMLLFQTGLFFLNIVFVKRFFS